MAGDDSSDASAFQRILFIALVLIALVPLVTLIWKTTNIRSWLWRSGCTSCVLCCDGYLGGGPYLYDDSDLQTLRELEEQRQAAAAYERYHRTSSRREPRMSLHLNSWREDVRSSIGDHDVLSTKLHHIQVVQAPAATGPPDTRAPMSPSPAQHSQTAEDEERDPRPW